MKKLFFFILLAGFQLCHSQECFTPDNQQPIQLNDGACNNYLFHVIGFNNFVQKQFNGQNGKWFPEDAEWIYIMPSPSGPEVQPVDFRVVSDTVIQGRQCVATTFQFDHLANNIRTIYFCEANDSVFFFNPLAKEFQLLYNFNLQKGDRYVISPSPECKDDSLVVYIDSTGEKLLNGKKMRVQYVHTQSISHAERKNHWQIGWNNKAVIYETIGSTSYFMPQETGWNDMFFDHLCQYSGDGIRFKSNPDESCEKTGVLEPDNTNLRLIVYPNPVSGMLHIQLADAEKGIVRITVCDLLGRVMLQKEILSKPELDVSSLPAGMYLLQVQTADGKILTAKFVKE